MNAETFLYLVTRGRNSGLPRRMEVWFVELDQVFYVLAESRDRADWVRNIEANPDVSFSIGNRRNAFSAVDTTDGLGRVVDEAGEAELIERVRAQMLAKYRWMDGMIVEIAPRR